MWVELKLVVLGLVWVALDTLLAFLEVLEEIKSYLQAFMFLYHQVSILVFIHQSLFQLRFLYRQASKLV
jgi:hypothetical protein